MSSNLNRKEAQFQNETENDDIEIEDIDEMDIQNEENYISNSIEKNSNNNNSNNDLKNTENNEEPIYVMTLALEQGKSEKIEIFSDSDPSELAYNFCQKNNLDFNALDYLREQITHLLETYAKNENDNEEENDNEDDNDIEEETGNDNDNDINEKEDNKEENENIHEIKEAQEEQEINSTENIKEIKEIKETKEDNINNVAFDDNINYKEKINNANSNDNGYKINKIKNDIEINEISPEDLIDNDEDNIAKNMEIKDIGNENANGNKELNMSDNVDNNINDYNGNEENEEENEKHDSDEIVEEIDFQNIHKNQDNNADEFKKEKEIQSQNEKEKLGENEKQKEDIESLPDIYIQKYDQNIINNNEMNANNEDLKENINNGEKNEEINNDNNYISNDDLKESKSKSLNENEKENLIDKDENKENELFLVENNNEKKSNNNNNDYISENKNPNQNIDEFKDIENINNITNNSKSKKKYKLNEDIIIGVGNFDEESKDDLDINGIGLNDIDKIKKEILEKETIKDDEFEENNFNIYENNKQENKNENKDKDINLESPINNNEKKENKKEENANNENIKDENKDEEINLTKNDKDNYKEKGQMNNCNNFYNYIQETKNTTNNNIYLNKEEENIKEIYPMNENKSHKEFQAKEFCIENKEYNNESLLSKTNKILNNGQKELNLFINKNNKDKIIINDKILNNNIIIPKNTNKIERKNDYEKYNFKNDSKYNVQLEKINTYAYKAYKPLYNNDFKNIKKINDNNGYPKYNENVGQNAKNYIKYLSERNRVLKEEKEKEIFSLEKQINKIDSKKKYQKTIPSTKGDIYNIEYNNNKNNNNINYYNKNISLRRLSKLKEEYEQKYSFQPIINDNYKTDLSFNERLNIFNNISKQKKEELKNNFSNLKADENGQEFFKPKLISRQYYSNNSRKNINNINNENDEKIDVFNKNYLYYKKYDSNKEKLYNKYYYNYTNEPHIYSKLQSDKLLSEATNKAFCNLFNELDSDQDNLITVLNINLSNIPDNILKILEPLLIELKEDNQSLNQNEFVKAMNKLFENISSIERRQLINEYNNRRQKNINDKNKYLNNYNHNLHNSRKNNSLIKKEKDNSINNNNYSSKRMITRSNITTDNNNFDNNYLSSRPKTPVYNMVKKNNGYNFFSNLNNQKSQKTIVNNNTNKLAQKHFMRIQKMMDDYSNKYKNTNNEKNLYNCFDKKINYSGLNNKIPKNNCRDLMLNENKKFSSINDCTFSNYIKNLNYHLESINQFYIY